MAIDGFKTADVWQASVLAYAGYEISGIDIINDRYAEFTFAAPSEDAKILLDDYEAGNLVLSDAKAFVRAFNVLVTKKNDLKRRGETSWASTSWISGYKI